MINEISPEQWDRMLKEREQWINIGTSCEPADWETAEEGITNFYRRMKWNDEITFHRVPSPLAAQHLLREKFGARGFVDTNLWGQMDAYWVGYLRILSGIPGIKVDDKKMELLGVWEKIVTSCGWWYPVDERTCIICDRPCEMHFSDDRRLHNETGPAVLYRDGYSIYSYNGVRIPRRLTWIITNPEKITVEKINEEVNIEYRRIMTDILGISKFLEETEAKVIDVDMVKVLEDDDITMPRALMEDRSGRKFLVGTDGSTDRVYYMEVDPSSITCTEAHNSIAPVDESLIDGNS